MNLDVFRGLAALMMIFNHAGYAWLQEDATRYGLTGDWLFVTSMAPVLFFFATGIGMGWSLRSQPLTASVWRKAGLLFVADMFLNWSGGILIGLNFFGFIGLATIVVGAVRSTRQPAVWALSMIFLLLVLRYVPLAAWKQWAQQVPILAFVSGVEPTEGVSYPLSPWLIYPLLGFVLAWTRGYWSSQRAAVPWLCMGTVTLIAVTSSTVLAYRGVGFFRWGTMSANYFIASIAVLSFAWALARAILSAPQVTAALALRGPASLLVVPLHYALIGSANAVLDRPVAISTWWLLASVLAGVVMLASRGLAAALVANRLGTGTLRIFLTIAAVSTLASYMTDAPALLTRYLGCVGQILVAWTLSRDGLRPMNDLPEVVRPIRGAPLV